MQSCNTSSIYFKKYEANCLKSFGIKFEEINIIKNKEFNEKSKILKLKFGATDIIQILYIETKKNYYCEYYVSRDIIKCQILDENMNIVSEKILQFEY